MKSPTRVAAVPSRAAILARVAHLESVNGSQLSQIERLRQDVQTEKAGRRAEEVAYRDVVKGRDETIAQLRDNLMAYTVTNATLEGYIIRANEDDPAPPLPIHRQFGAKQEQMSFSADAIDQVSAPMTFMANDGSNRRRGWWNRQ